MRTDDFVDQTGLGNALVRIGIAPLNFVFNERKCVSVHHQGDADFWLFTVLL